VPTSSLVLRNSSTTPPALARTDSGHTTSFGNVLIHCFAGKSRSVTILLSYLLRLGWSLTDAYEHVKRCRPALGPNPGFMAQLRELEIELRNGQTSADIAPALAPPLAPPSPAPLSADVDRGAASTPLRVVPASQAAANRATSSALTADSTTVPFSAFLPPPHT
jgi:hypothetical protein